MATPSRLESGLALTSPGSTPPKAQGGQTRCRAEIALGRAATGRARMLLDGRTVTIRRVGRSYNRTVARSRRSRWSVAMSGPN
ncbi:MAG: hypothetical protein ACLGIM_07530 [Alphaproteobacteria bacterium]